MTDRCTGTKSNSTPATYRAVKADKKVKERRWWDSVKDATKTIRNLVNKIRGALEYVQQFFNDISRVVADIIEVANEVLSFFNLITDTINKVLANRIRAVGVALSTSVLGLPIAVSQAFQKMADDFEGIAVSIKSSIQNSLQASATSSTTGRRNALAAESVARSASPATAIS